MIRLLLFLALFTPLTLTAQGEDRDKIIYEQLNTQVERILAGDLGGLRALTHFLDDRNIYTRGDQSGSTTTTPRETFFNLLYQFTDFHNITITDSLRSEELNDFLKNNSIVFSPHLEKFTDKSLSERTVDYQLIYEPESEPPLSLEEIKAKINDHLLNKKYYEIVEILDQAGSLATPEAFAFLQECANGLHWGKGLNSRENQIYNAIAFALRYFETMESARLILKIMKEHGGYYEMEYVIALARVTNHDLFYENRKYDLIDFRYSQLLDSIQDINALQDLGYSKYIGYKPEDFENPVDYYGQVMLDSRHLWWINYHATKELVKFRDPKILMYLASLSHLGTEVYNDPLGRRQIFPFHLITELTGIRLMVKDGQNRWTKSYGRQAGLNLLAYWHNHYTDYEWNEGLQRFVNINEEPGNLDRIGILFEKLGSRHKHIAQESFKELTQSNPDSVISLAHQFFIGGPNLPTFGKRFLEQLVFLTEFCRNNNLDFTGSKRFQKDFQALLSSPSLAERYRLELSMVESMNFEDVTALEYYTCLDDQLVFSVSRILDKWYSRHWQAITNDDLLLKAYLKKAALFKKLSIVGNVNHYLRRFTSAPTPTVDKLRELSLSETDADIRTAVIEALNLDANSQQGIKAGSISVNEYVSNPDDYGFEANEYVHFEHTQEEYEQILGVLRSEKDDLYTLNKFIDLIFRNLKLEMTPMLISGLDINTVIQRDQVGQHDEKGGYHTLYYELTVADWFVSFLEKLHDYQFPLPKEKVTDARIVSSYSPAGSSLRNRRKTASQWKYVFDENEDFKSWGEIFFEKKLNDIKEVDTVSVYDLNEIFKSPFFTDGELKGLRHVIARISPCNDISALAAPDGFLRIEDLAYFRDCEFERKDMSKVVRQFRDLATQPVLNQISVWASRKNVLERAYLYTDLLRSTRFDDWLDQLPGLDSLRKDVLDALLLLDKDSGADDYFNNTVKRLIAQLSLHGKSIDEKLIFAGQMPEKAGTLYSRSLLQDMSYEDLGVLFQHVNKLPWDQSQKSIYLSRDLAYGLPLKFNNKILKELQVNHPKMTEIEFRLHYLRKTGLDFETNGKLDYRKIYHIFQFDLPEPFMGAIASPDETHVHSLIKVLFHHFSDYKKVTSEFSRNFKPLMPHDYVLEETRRWMKFLVDYGFVVPPTDIGPSISRIMLKR